MRSDLFSTLPLVALLLLALALFSVAAPFPADASTQPEVGAMLADPEPEVPGDPNYSKLADLVLFICDEAIGQFDGFFGPAPVTVHPFETFSSRNDGYSYLGVTLADQMIAAINNNIDQNGFVGMDDREQEVYGILQEVDGILRLHVNGRNHLGVRRSYVVTVEMSEPLYRALHTTIPAIGR